VGTRGIGGGVGPSAPAGGGGIGGGAGSPIGAGAPLSGCKFPSKSVAQLDAGRAVTPPGASDRSGGSVAAAGAGASGGGAFAAGIGMSNSRAGSAGVGGGVSVSAGFAPSAAGPGVDSSEETSTAMPTSESSSASASASSLGRSGATGVRSAGESSIPGSGMNVAVWAPSVVIHSASALSRASRVITPAEGVSSGPVAIIGASSCLSLSRKPSSDSRPANSLMPSTVRSTP
jgi:hypothetical protein